MTGALAFTAVTLPSSRSPRGEFLAPFTLFQTPPPMAPMAKAPPMSSKMRCGQGSRSCTDILLRRDEPLLRAGGELDAWEQASGRPIFYVTKLSLAEIPTATRILLRAAATADIAAELAGMPPI